MDKENYDQSKDSLGSIFSKNKEARVSYFNYNSLMRLIKVNSIKDQSPYFSLQIS